MKKLLLSIFAVAALFSCSKSDITFDDEPTQIGFSPVAKNITKSVAGYNGDAFDGIFPTNVDLYVFANALEPNATDYGDPYFINARFYWASDKGSVSSAGNNGANLDDDDQNNDDITATAGAYVGDPTRYWPNVKQLIFAGVSQACNVNAETNVVPSMDFENDKLTINGYKQSNYTETTENGTVTYTYPQEGSNDLMWFSRTVAYDKQDNEIVTNMKHACSWITIKIKGNGVTSGKWTLNSLVIKNIIHECTKVECDDNTAVWTLPNTPTTADEIVYTNGTTTITADAKKYENSTNNTIVIPQTPTSLDITYTYVSDAANGLTLTETKNVPLKYTATGQENTEWQSGIHYIYNITITATEILIDPVVVNWTPHTGNEIEK